MSYTPFNAPLLSGLLGDKEITACFSVRVDIAAMALFEAALARATAAVGLIPKDAGEAISTACSRFEPDLEKLNVATARDGVIVPELVEQIRAAVGERHARHVHFGATSQDVIDTSLTIRLKPVFARLRERLQAISKELEDLDRRFGERPLEARTRMQLARSITVSNRLKTWHAPVSRHVARLQAVMPRLVCLQLGGAVGTREAFGANGDAVAARMGEILDLAVPSAPWHSARDNVVEFTSVLSLICGSLGKIGQDIALMAQNEIDEVKLGGTGGSSAMPHKRNPVRAEALVTLARFNAALAGGMEQAMIHEQERSGAAWTLEWMLLPQMCVAAGASTRLALELLRSIERLGAVR